MTDATWGGAGKRRKEGGVCMRERKPDWLKDECVKSRKETRVLLGFYCRTGVNNLPQFREVTNQKRYTATVSVLSTCVSEAVQVKTLL